LRLNFRLKGYLWTVRWGMVILLLAAGGFHTKKLCGRLHSIEGDLFKKRKKRFLSHPLGTQG